MALAAGAARQPAEYLRAAGTRPDWRWRRSSSAYAYDSEMGQLRQQVETLDGAQTAYIEDSRQRTRAIAELTYTMSATLNYQKVLDAMLEAGRIGLRMPEREQSKLFAGVFLFHVDDNRLHVVSSRRFTRADDARIAFRHGRDRRAGAARSRCRCSAPTPMHDPELQNFVAFQGCKSLLCIPLRAGFDNFGVLLYGSDTPNAFTAGSQRTADRARRSGDAGAAKRRALPQPDSRKKSGSSTWTRKRARSSRATCTTDRRRASPRSPCA